jgi:hypothetical protein
MTILNMNLKWFLELWNVAHAVLGLVAVIFIQRAIHKVLIAVFLSREFKHDETNRAWWTGKWYGRGLGSYAMSQPAREFIVKTIELSLWSSDFLTCHILLFLLTPPVLIPYIDRFHSTLLCESLGLTGYLSTANFALQSGFGPRNRSGHPCIRSSRNASAVTL